MKGLVRTIASLATLSWIRSVEGAPRAVRWSDKTLGPDGPWNAAEITLGGGQSVAVYPGKMWESFFPSENYCSNTTAAGQPCYAQQAGAIYNKSKGSGHRPSVVVNPPEFYTGNLLSSGTKRQRYVDDFYLENDTSQWGLGKIDDFAMVLMDDAQIKYPNGKLVPMFAGCLSFGAAPGIVNHSFIVTPGTVAGAVNTSLLVGTLFTDHVIDSQTFGMHLGSATDKKVAPSLMLGGYDKNRAVNDMLSLPIPDPYGAFSDAPLEDISIDVVKGGSPFPWDSKAGLLAAGNSSIGGRLGVSIDPCLPYINLPKSTCDAIAAEIPVKYDDGLGLYLWDTASPDYSRIIQSPSVLTFHFTDPDNNTRKVNISVPFTHLNLTLDAPLVDKPTPYFPCNAVSYGNYALGRAFLQDAFFGANLKTAVYFISQASGPNFNGENVVTMDSECRDIEPSNNNWETSWEGYWTPLPGKEAVTSDNSSSSPTGGTSSNLAGTIAGATVGGVAGIAILGFILFLGRRYKKYGKGVSLCGVPLIKDKPAAYYGANPASPGTEKSPAESWPTQPPAHELPQDSHVWQLPANVTDRAAEMETPYTVHEMPADNLRRNGNY
ncbi:hypothetical protein F5Y04DRAFT_252019 [Hypomontagnella monticulosa]|nr:hypothetical protein F5Y04DRAFT_252019 [Hypomontagnella monticulosa]